MVGGYSPVTNFEDDSCIVEAATFAFQELRSPSSPYTISTEQGNTIDIDGFKIVKASQQVVAGMNYRLELVFQDSLGSCVGAGTVVVYNHFGDLSITSSKVTKTACGELDSDNQT